jgi:hypothetical protein
VQIKRKLRTYATAYPQKGFVLFFSPALLSLVLCFFFLQQSKEPSQRFLQWMPPATRWTHKWIDPTTMVPYLPEFGSIPTPNRRHGDFFRQEHGAEAMALRPSSSFGTRVGHPPYLDSRTLFLHTPLQIWVVSSSVCGCSPNPNSSLLV